MKEMKKVKLAGRYDYSTDKLWDYTLQDLVDDAIDRLSDTFALITGESLEDRGAGDDEYYWVEECFDNGRVCFTFEFLVYMTDEELLKLYDVEDLWLVEEI